MNRSLRQMASRPRRNSKPPKAAMVAATLLLVFHIIAIFAAPDRLPLLIQRLVGLTAAALAMLTVVFGINEFAGNQKSFRRPPWLKLDPASIAGFLAFLLVLAWWFSPWAPIKVDHSEASRANELRGDPQLPAAQQLPA